MTTRRNAILAHSSRKSRPIQQPKEIAAMTAKLNEKNKADECVSLSENAALEEALEESSFQIEYDDEIYNLLELNKIYEEIDIAPECDINNESFKGNIMRNIPQLELKAPVVSLFEGAIGSDEMILLIGPIAVEIPIGSVLNVAVTYVANIKGVETSDEEINGISYSEKYGIISYSRKYGIEQEILEIYGNIMRNIKPGNGISYTNEELLHKNNLNIKYSIVEENINDKFIDGELYHSNKMIKFNLCQTVEENSNEPFMRSSLDDIVLYQKDETLEKVKEIFDDKSCDTESSTNECRISMKYTLSFNMCRKNNDIDVYMYKKMIINELSKLYNKSFQLLFGLLLFGLLFVRNGTLILLIKQWNNIVVCGLTLNIGLCLLILTLSGEIKLCQFVLEIVKFNEEKYNCNFINILSWIGFVLWFIASGIDELDIKDFTNLYLGIVLTVVVTLTCILGYYQESKLIDLMSCLLEMKSKNVIMTRDNKRIKLESHDLIPGDICDLSIINCSSLTGESELQKRDWKSSDEPPAVSANLCFFGTLVVNGKGRGVVIATGDEIFMGRFAQLAISIEGEESQETPIAKEIKGFVFKVSLIAFVLGIIFFIIGMVENGNLVANVIFLIGGIFIIGCDNGIILYLAINASLHNSRNNRRSNALLNKFKQKIKKLYCNYINGYRFDEYNHEEIKLLHKSTSLNVLSSIIMKKKIYEQCLDDGTIIDSNVAFRLEQYLQTRQSRALSGNNILVKLNNVNDLDFKNQTEFKTHNKYITQIIKNNQILITLSNVLIANNNDNNNEESTSNINGDVNVFSCTFVVLTVTLSVFDATFFVFDGILVQMVYLALLWKLLSKSMCNIEQLFNIRCKCNNKITNRQELINIHGFNESNVWYCNLQIIKIFKNKLFEDVFHNENTLHLSKNKFAEKCIEIENELNKTNALKKHLVLCCDDEYDRRVDQSFTKVYVIKLYENNAHLFLSQVKFNNEVQCIFNKNQWYKNLLQINKGRNSLMNDKFKFDSNILHLLKDKQGSNGIETCIFVANNKQIKKILLKQLILECNEFVFVMTLSFNKENIFAITLFKLDTLDITIIILLQINVSNVIARKTNIQQIKTFEIKMNNGQNENYINGIITESLTFKKMINEEYDNELIKYLNCSNNVWFDLLIAVLSGVAVLLVCIWYGQMIELLIQLYDLLKCSSRICDINELKNINKQEIDDDIIKIVIILFENRSKCIRQNNDHENIIGCMKTMESLIIFQSNYEQIKYRNYNDTVKSINWDTFVKQKQLQIILETSYINMCINVELQFEIKLLIADRMRIKLYKIIQHYVSKILIKCESNDKLRLKHLKNDTLSFDLYSEIYSLNIYINTNIGNGLIYLHAIVLDQSQNNDLFNNQNMNKFNGGNNSGTLLIQFCNLYKTSITLHNINDYAQLMNQFYKQNIQEVNSKFGISWQWLFGLCGVLVIMSLFKAYQCGKITEILIYIGYSIPYELLSGKISRYNQYNNCSLVNHVSMDLYAYIFAMLGVLTKYYYSIRRQLFVFKESTCSFLSVLCVDTDYVKVYANEIKSLCLIGNCKSCQFLDINGKSLNDTNLQICNNINITGTNISCLIECVYRMHNLRLVLDATIRKKLKETILKILGIFVKILMYSLLKYIGQIVSGVFLNETRHIRNGLNKNTICIDTKESDIKQAIEIFITTVEIECKDNNSNITLIIGLFEVISSIIYHFESEKYNDKICRLEVEICLEFIINKVELIHEEKVNVSNVPLQLYYYENTLIYYNKCAENEDYSLQKHLLYENITMNHGDKFGYITTYVCEPGEYYKLALSSRLDESSSYYNLVLNPNNNIYRNKCNEFIGSFSGSLIEYNNGNDVNIEYNLTIDSKIRKSIEHGMYSNNDRMNNTNHCCEDECDGDKINLNGIAKEEYKINTIKIGIVITLSLILLSSILCIITLMNTFYCSLYFSILWTYLCITNERTKCLLEMKEHCQVLGFCGSYLSELYTLVVVYSLKFVVNKISNTWIAILVSLKFVTNRISNTWIAILAIVFDAALFSLFSSKWYSVMSIFMKEMGTSLLAQFSLVIMGMISGVNNVQL